MIPSGPAKELMTTTTVAGRRMFSNLSHNLAGVVKRFGEPVLVLAGERDTYNNCCLIERMRVIETAARENALPFGLVGPQAGHGFNLSGGSYRGDVAADAWRRTRDKLAQHLPLQK